jgi:hypothetical protein
MKEVLTKRFWQDVKKTYYEALEGPPADGKALQPPAESGPNASPAPAPPDQPPSSTSR